MAFAFLLHSFRPPKAMLLEVESYAFDFMKVSTEKCKQQ